MPSGLASKRLKGSGARFDELLPAPEPVYLFVSQKREPVQTLDGGMHAPVAREQLNSGILVTSVLGTTETNIIVAVRWLVVVAVGATHVVWIIVPRPAAQHPRCESAPARL